jgi:hypothetical protein
MTGMAGGMDPGALMALLGGGGGGGMPPGMPPGMPGMGAPGMPPELGQLPPELLMLLLGQMGGAPGGMPPGMPPGMPGMMPQGMPPGGKMPPGAGGA